MELSAPPVPFSPPGWGTGPHVQTILGNYLPSTVPALPWEAHTLALPDGDVLALRALKGRTRLVVHLFHGLGGSADSGYLQRISARLGTRGHGVVAVNHRGAGEGRGRAARPYHSGSSGDVSAVLAWARARQPGHLHVAVGFSLSANMLLLLLGERRSGHHLPDAALAVHPPVDLEACSRRLRQGLNRAYDRHFVGALRQVVRERWEAGLIPPVDLPPGITLRDFDQLYTAPQAGFRDRDDYYTRCSSGPHLGAITTPAVILSARDDPFAPAGDILACPRGSSVRLHVEAHGGHMGYIAARPTPLGDRRWLDYAVDHYVQALADQLT